MSLWFQAVQGASAFKSGIDLLPLTTSLLAFSVIAGWLMTWLGRYKQIQFLSAIVVVAGAALLATIECTSGESIWVPALFLVGMGVGSGVSCPFIAAGAVLKVSDISVGMAVLTFAQDLGESVVVGGAQSLFLNQLTTNLAQFAPRLDPGYIIDLGATGFQGQVPQSSMLGLEIAYNQALRATFYLTTAIASCTVVLALLIPGRYLKDH